MKKNREQKGSRKNKEGENLQQREERMRGGGWVSLKKNLVFFLSNFLTFCFNIITKPPHSFSLSVQSERESKKISSLNFFVH